MDKTKRKKGLGDVPKDAWNAAKAYIALADALHRAKTPEERAEIKAQIQKLRDSEKVEGF